MYVLVTFILARFPVTRWRCPELLQLVFFLLCTLTPILENNQLHWIIWLDPYVLSSYAKRACYRLQTGLNIVNYYNKMLRGVLLNHLFTWSQQKQLLSLLSDTSTPFLNNLSDVYYIVLLFTDDNIAHIKRPQYQDLSRKRTPAFNKCNPLLHIHCTCTISSYFFTQKCSERLQAVVYY